MADTQRGITRRAFLELSAGTLGAWTLGSGLLQAGELAWPARLPKPAKLTDLPKGSAPAPVPLPHFPDRLHAFVWRNWTLVPLDRMAQGGGATRDQLRRIGRAMGLSGPPSISADQQRRSALTVIRRNWHLLPYRQLLQLLGWTAEQLAFSLREDDFLFVKLGNLKPECEVLAYQDPSDDAVVREKAIAETVQRYFASGLEQQDPLFGFVKRLSRKPRAGKASAANPSDLSPRYCYSYFALYGDPLLDDQADPYPKGYLAQLAGVGVNGVWLQGVLSKLAPFEWQPELSENYEKRLANLRRLTARAAARGIGVYLYLNEPRALPLAFFETRPELKGVTEGDHATLCTSHPAVQKYLTKAVQSICTAVPDLAGIFTITASENLTNCWSHGGGARCPRCQKRSPAEVIAEVNTLFQRGIEAAGTKTQLLAWDWGWGDDWAEATIAKLPAEATLVSVSEWGTPIRRGGIETTVGEYSISVVGPGARAQKRWSAAHARGLRTVAKVQAGNTWELSAVPYIPALENVARHAVNLRKASIDGLMLGWTLGGYPSPNLELFCRMAQASPDDSLNADGLMLAVAQQRFGLLAAEAVVRAWKSMSAAFSEFPFAGELVYTAPLQSGPSNLLWAKPTGYRATMVGFPYDDLDSWRAVYPAEVYVSQFEKVADGFERATGDFAQSFQDLAPKLPAVQRRAIRDELNVAQAAAVHFRSVANQGRFYVLRKKLAGIKASSDKEAIVQEMYAILRDEIRLAQRLQAIQKADSRIGFEASNQYYYVGMDLAEKILNCEDLLNRGLQS